MRYFFCISGLVKQGTIIRYIILDASRSAVPSVCKTVIQEDIGRKERQKNSQITVFFQQMVLHDLEHEKIMLINSIMLIINLCILHFQFKSNNSMLLSFYDILQVT